MNSLEVPLHLSGVNIKSHNGVTEQVIALAVESVEVAGRAPEGGVEGVGLLIHGHIKAPVIRSGAVFPLVSGPGIVTRLAGPRDGVKFPLLGAGAGVVGSGIAGLAGGGLLGHVGADEQ